jgi:hypothetical protein
VPRLRPYRFKMVIDNWNKQKEKAAV